MRPREANGDAVILLHGVSDNRLGMYGYGKWLLDNHYSVLMPDAGIAMFQLLIRSKLLNVMCTLSCIVPSSLKA
jgi:predicted esterase